MTNSQYERLRVTDVPISLKHPDYILYKSIIQFIPRDNVFNSVLDFGAGEAPYEALISHNNYYKIDVQQNTKNDIDLVIQPNAKVPLEDESFDLVMLMDVLEHVEDPGFVLTEIKRMLRPGGRCIISVPYLYREHETPHDYYRFTSYGIRLLLEKNNFLIKGIKKVGNPSFTICSLFLERSIFNGEKNVAGFFSKVLTKLLVLFYPLLNLTIFSGDCDDDAGIFHHLLIDVEKM